MSVTLWKTVPQPVQLRRIIGQADRCTCHIPADSKFGRHDLDPRAIVLYDGMIEWQHVDDGTAASTHHIHHERSTRDCDGPMDRSYVSLPNPGEEGQWEFNHWMRALQWLANPAVDSEGHMVVRKHDDGTYSAEWSAPTEEGFEHETITLCRDPHCAYDTYMQRDHYAEAMGY